MTTAKRPTSVPSAHRFMTSHDETTPPTHPSAKTPMHRRRALSSDLSPDLSPRLSMQLPSDLPRSFAGASPRSARVGGRGSLPRGSDLHRCLARLGAIVALSSALGVTSPLAAQTVTVPAQRIVPAQRVVPAQRGVAIMPAMPAMPAPGGAAAVPLPPPEAGAAAAEASGAATGMPAPVEAAPPISPAELALLKATYAALEEPDRESMRAYYADLGIDLEQVLGIADARSAAAMRGQMIAMAMREQNAERTPEAVLAARARLGFGQVPFPDGEVASPQDVARWVALHSMAGEWETLGAFLASRPVDEAAPVYAALLQSTNRGDAGLLPEEVLLFAEASPKEFEAWQLAALAGMLRQAAARNSVATLLDLIAGETRFFGAADEVRRRRTVEFLAAAGLVAEAYAFLPPLADARAAGDAAMLVVHARHQLDLAARAGESPEADARRLSAFEILAEASLAERAAIEARLEALRLAVSLMSQIPKSRTAPWLAEVFASPALGPATLEQVALAAASIGNRQLEDEERADAILNLKESVDVLLARDDVDAAALRVPLRMVTTALVAEMEKATSADARQQFLAPEATQLYRAIPSERWLAALEPSLAARARKASIAIAAVADETDRAIELLGAAIARSPGDAADYADHFLAAWTGELRPKVEYDDEMMMFFAFYRDAMPSAPLTRGRQRRNLDRLDAVMATLREAGVDPRTLPAVVSAFEACHARTEVYERADVERVFGPIPTIPATTAAMLAATMGASLNGDWRSREAQRATGTKRSDGEIALLVDRGYGVAIDLVESAVAQRPDAWNLAVLAASLAYDRLQFQQSLASAPDAESRESYRRAAFAAFADAAARYADALARGETRDDPSVHLRWFGAAMGTAELNFLRPEDLPKEGTLQDDQIDLIRRSIESLEPEAQDRHVAAFAAAVQQAVARSNPEVKPRLVRHALRIVGDHPAGATLRSMEELYRDLVKDEIKLRLAIDGDDRVGVGEPFGVLLSLRFTHSVDRETGGFAKYLQNGVYARVGNQFRVVNYRDDLTKSIETAFGERFDLEAIGFFDAFMPPHGVVEGGEEGWLEKPLAYLVLSRRDPAIDAVPPIVMDMQFTDQTGPVSLAVGSNSPMLALGDARSPRPCRGLEVSQLVDVRGVVVGDGEPPVLEVRLRGEGVVPEVRDALVGLDDALAGYAIAADGIVADPPIVITTGDPASSRGGMFAMAPAASGPATAYPEPDAEGMVRLPIERTVRLTYAPTGGAVGGEFTLPRLAPGVEGTLESRFYDELDIMPAVGGSISTGREGRRGVWIAAGVGGAVALAVVGLLARRRPATTEASATWRPARLTPLGVVTSLRRLERERGGSLGESAARSLREEIVRLERACFGPGGGAPAEPELRAVVERWSGE